MTDKAAYLVMSSLGAKIADDLTGVETEAFIHMLKIMGVKAQLDNSKLYLRFGELPKRENNYTPEGYRIVNNEEGIAVWECKLISGIPFPVLPDDPSDLLTSVFFRNILKECPVYLMTGEELDMVGECDQILISKYRVIQDCTKLYSLMKSGKGKESDSNDKSELDCKSFLNESIKSLMNEDKKDNEEIKLGTITADEDNESSLVKPHFCVKDEIVDSVGNHGIIVRIYQDGNVLVYITLFRIHRNTFSMTKMYEHELVKFTKTDKKFNKLDLDELVEWGLM